MKFIVKNDKDCYIVEKSKKLFKAFPVNNLYTIIANFPSSSGYKEFAYGIIDS